MELVFLLLLIVLLVLALTSGFPVAFALPGSAIIAIALAALTGFVFTGNPDAYFAHGGPVQWLSAGVTNFRSLYWNVERDTLIAIPLFIFMGIMLQRSKIAEDLLVAMAKLFGPVPGGLGISVVLVGALLAATTGIVGATVIAMGLISLPAMLRNNYSKSLACGTICASGTLGQIIPPSIVLIILADQLSSAADQASTVRRAEYKEATGEFAMPSVLDIPSASAGDMFMGALIPGLILVGLYMLYILITAGLKPENAPPVPHEGSYDRQFFVQVLLALVPPLMLIFIVLGSIILGIATVNQAGAIGAVGAMIMGGYRLTQGQSRSYWPAMIAIASVLIIAAVLSQYDLNIKSINSDAEANAIRVALGAVFTLLLAVLWSAWRAYRIENTLNEVMLETAKTTSMVFIILIGAAMLTSAFRGFGGEELVKEFLTGLPGGFWTQFIVVMAVIFLLGFFLDFIEIAVVVVPIVAPILLADPGANVTAVWLGVMIGLNIQTSFLTPPFGFALFYLRGVAPKIVQTWHIYKGVLPFIGLQLLALCIAGFFPMLVNYLPNRTYLTSENAPPPKNPRLQLCLEDYVFEQYKLQQEDLGNAIKRMRAVDVDFLPGKQQRALEEGLDKASATYTRIEAIERANQALLAFEPKYRLLHVQVRSLQAHMRDVEAEIKVVNQSINLLSRDAANEPKLQIRVLEQNIQQLERRKADLVVSVPLAWDSARKDYLRLSDAEKKARMQYRNNADQAYESVIELREMVESAEHLAGAESQLLQLSERVAHVTDQATAKAVIAEIKLVEKKLTSVAVTSSIRSKLSKARRLLKKKLDVDEAMVQINKAVSAFEQDLNWRRQAGVNVLPALIEYDQSISQTIGLRMQERLTLGQAETVAACLSDHKDVSLKF